MAWLIPERISDDHCRRHGWWVLLALTALLYLPGLGNLPLMDRDEPRFAHATVEMMQRGAWVIPYFNSDPAVSDAARIEQMHEGKGAMEVGYRFDKPPLTYWWMRLHYLLFGVNEFAARLHSVLAVWLVGLVTFGMASRLAGARAGLMAGITWITTLQVIVHGHLCVADMPMVLFVTLACWALLECLALGAEGEQATAEPRPSFSFWHWTLYLSLGLGFLAKGPVTFLVPGLALVLMRFAFWRKPLPWRRLKLWQGLPVSLLIIAAWGIPALLETQGLYWKVGMQEHVVERGAKAFNGRFPVPGYYLATALLSLFPWIALLPMVWTKVREKWDAKMAFLVSWLAAPYIIFTLYATQLPHYVMPGFPAAMMLLVVCGDLRTGKKWHTVFMAVVLGLLLLVSFSAWIGFTQLLPASAPAAGQETNPFMDLIAMLVLASLGLSFYTLVCAGLVPLAITPAVRKHTVGILIAAVSMAGFCGLMLKFSTSAGRRVHPAAMLAEKAGPLPAKVELLAWEYNEPSLVFHFNHMWRFPGKLETVVSRMERKGPRVVVLLRREWTLSRFLSEKLHGKTELATEQDHTAEVDAVIAAHPDYQVVSFSGMNSARASWAELRMLVRK